MTVAQVADGLIYSHERNQKIVRYYYEEFLNRQPELNGLNSWVNQLDQGLIDQGDVAIGLLSSTEYFNKARES